MDVELQFRKSYHTLGMRTNEANLYAHPVPRARSEKVLQQFIPHYLWLNISHLVNFDARFVQACISTCACMYVLSWWKCQDLLVRHLSYVRIHPSWSCVFLGMDQKDDEWCLSTLWNMIYRKKWSFVTKVELLDIQYMSVLMHEWSQDSVSWCQLGLIVISPPYTKLGLLLLWFVAY